MVFLHGSLSPFFVDTFSISIVNTSHSSCFTRLFIYLAFICRLFVDDLSFLVCSQLWSFAFCWAIWLRLFPRISGDSIYIMKWCFMCAQVCEVWTPNSENRLLFVYFGSGFWRPLILAMKLWWIPWSLSHSKAYFNVFQNTMQFHDFSFTVCLKYSQFWYLYRPNCWCVV